MVVSADDEACCLEEECLPEVEPESVLLVLSDVLDFAGTMRCLCKSGLEIEERRDFLCILVSLSMVVSAARDRACLDEDGLPEVEREPELLVPSDTLYFACNLATFSCTSGFDMEVRRRRVDFGDICVMEISIGDHFCLFMEGVLLLTDFESAFVACFAFFDFL